MIKVPCAIAICVILSRTCKAGPVFTEWRHSPPALRDSCMHLLVATPSPQISLATENVSSDLETSDVDRYFDFHSYESTADSIADEAGVQGTTLRPHLTRLKPGDSQPIPENDLASPYGQGEGLEARAPNSMPRYTGPHIATTSCGTTLQGPRLEPAMSASTSNCKDHPIFCSPPNTGWDTKNRKIVSSHPLKAANTEQLPTSSSPSVREGPVWRSLPRHMREAVLKVLRSRKSSLGTTRQGTLRDQVARILTMSITKQLLSGKEDEINLAIQQLESMKHKHTSDWMKGLKIEERVELARKVAVLTDYPKKGVYALLKRKGITNQIARDMLKADSETFDHIATEVLGLTRRTPRKTYPAKRS